jgi:hexulose-6-phosphate isomerase
MTTSAATTVALANAGQAASHGKRQFVKSLKFGMVNGGKNASIEDRLQIAKNAGFASVEPDTIFDPNELEETIKAADKVGIKLDAIICSKHWSNPLSDPNPEVRKVCIDAMKTSIDNAKEMGGDMVLLVPGVVTPQVMYKDVWERSIRYTKELAEYAEDKKITIGIENVWNKFLLSPLEYRHFIDEVGSDYVKAWFDVGNVVLFAYPQDWIRTLKEQIVRIDVKDFKMGGGTYDFTKLLDGTIDWKEVMTAFDEIGFQGIMAAEVGGGDEAYLTEFVSQRMDQIIAM